MIFNFILISLFVIFQEWVEFSPYEIGIAKYGTFMKSEDFGNKFIVGKKIKHFEELPLHFLQGKILLFSAFPLISLPTFSIIVIMEPL